MVVRGGEGGREDALNGWGPIATVTLLGLGLLLLLSSPTEVKLFRQNSAKMHPPNLAQTAPCSRCSKCIISSAVA